MPVTPSIWSRQDRSHTARAPPHSQYTLAGDIAGQNSNIFVSSTTRTTDVQAIDWWMGAPFHAMSMMDPRLTTTGFGSYRNSAYSPWQMSAAVNVSQGMTAGGTYPVYFPGNLSTEPLTTYSGNETPNPQLACPGYTGLPLFIEVGANVNTTAGPVHTLIANGASLANCVVDSTNATFASNLKWRGGVIVFPQQPLQNGVTYTVALAVNAVPYTWSFTVGPLGASCSPGVGGAPSVSSLNPNSGSTAGGTTVTINGCGFTGVTGVKFGTTTATSFSFVSDSQVTAISPAHAAGSVDVAVTTAIGTNAASGADKYQYVPPSVYTSRTPLRVLDTRNSSALGPGGSLTLQLGGVSVPANATSVILNVTVTNTTASSSLTLYPTGNSLPLASNLNWVAGQTVPNLVSVRLGTNGSVNIYNPTGYTHVIVDLEGYFAPAVSGSAGEFVTLAPSRITDTRTGSGQPNAGLKMSPYSTLDIQVTGGGEVPSGTAAQAVVLNVTVTETTANGGYMIVYPSGQAAPLASNLNWMAGQTVPNRVVVGVGANGKVSFTNAGGYTQLIVDVNGYFTSSTATGVSFVPLTPSRVLDTRNGTGGFNSKIGTGGTLHVQVSGQGGVPSIGGSNPPQAVILNVTVVNPTAFGWFIIYPDGTLQPLASDLNFNAGQIVPNLVVVKLGANGKIALFNANGSSDAVIDVEGWFG